MPNKYFRDPKYQNGNWQLNGKELVFKPIGRDPEITPEIIIQIIEYLQDGAYIETAVQACGIDEKTWYNWQNKAKAGEPFYVTFLQAIKTAKALVEINFLHDIRDNNNNKWQNLAWIMERTMPEKYSLLPKQPVNDDAEKKNIDAIPEPPEDYSGYLERRQQRIRQIEESRHG